MTMTGSRAATTSTKSIGSPAGTSSRMSRAMSRMWGSSREMAPGVKARLIRARWTVWRGGSMVIRVVTTSPTPSSSPPRIVIPCPLQYVTGSFEMARTSSWRLMAQKPAGSNQYTGRSSRSHQ